MKAQLAHNPTGVSCNEVFLSLFTLIVTRTAHFGTQVRGAAAVNTQMSGKLQAAQASEGVLRSNQVSRTSFCSV